MANEQKITEIIDEVAFQQLGKLQSELQRSADLYADFGAKVIELNKSVGGAKSFKELNKAIEDQTKAEAAAIQSKAKLLAAQNKLDAEINKQLAIAEKKAAIELRAEKTERQRIKSAQDFEASQKKLNAALEDNNSIEAKSNDSKRKLIESQNKLDAAIQKQISLAEKKAAADLKAASAERLRADAAVRISATVGNAKDSEYDATMKLAVTEEQRAKSLVSSTAASKSYVSEAKRREQAEEEATKSALATSEINEKLGKNMTDLVKNGIRLRSELTDLKTELKELGDGASSGEIVKLNGLIEQQKIAISQNNTELKRYARENAAVAGSVDALEARLTILRGQFRALSQEERENVNVGGVLLQNINDLDTAYKEQRQSMGQHQDEVGNYGRALDFLPQSMQNIVGKLQELSDAEGKVTFSGLVSGIKEATLASLRFIATPIGAAITAIAVVLGAGKMWFDYNKGLQEATKLTRDFTGLQGDDLIMMRSRVQSIADVYGKDFKEVLEAVNSTANQFGISYNNALDVVTNGFIAGADASGNFLDSLKEYPTQLDAVGLSAEQTTALISQNVKSGIFSDKGIDSIKEGGLRLREMTKATREALDGIGLSSTKISADLESGQTSIFDVIQQVSGRLSELPPQSAAVGTAIADIFGGPGEDAGLRYLTTLKDINLNLSDTIDETDDLVKAQRLQLETTEILKTETASLFDATGGTFELLIANAKVFVTDLLIRMIRGVKDLYNWFAELYNNSLIARSAIAGFVVVFKQVFNTGKALFDFLFNNFAGMGRIIKAVLTGDLASIPDLIKQTVSDIATDFTAYGEQSAKNYADGFNQAVKGSIATISLNSTSGGSGKLDETIGTGRVGGTTKPPTIIDPKQTEKELKQAKKDAEEAKKIKADLEKTFLELSLQRLEGEQKAFSRNAQYAKEIVDNEYNNFDDRLKNLQYFLEQSNLEIDKENEIRKAEIKAYSKEAIELEAEGRKEQAQAVRDIALLQEQELGKEINAMRLQLVTEGNQMLISVYRDGAENAISSTEAQLYKAYDDNSKALAEKNAKGIISEREYSEQREQLSRKLTEDLIKNEIEQVEKIIELAKLKGVNVGEEERKLADLKMKLSNAVTQNEIADLDKIAERNKKLNDLKIELAKELSDMTFTMLNSAIERDMQKLELDQENLTKRQDEERKAIEQSVFSEQEKQAKLWSLDQKSAQQNEQLENKKAQLQMRQARLERSQAVVSILTNTAIAVTKVLPNLVLAGIVGAIGAAQLASVLSKPLPKYFKGTKSSPEGFAHVGERGTELMIEPNGNMLLTPNTDTVTYLKKGTEILTHEQTKKALTSKSLRGISNRDSIRNDISFNRLIDENRRGNKSVVKAIKNTGYSGTILTKSGLQNISVKSDKLNIWKKRNGL